MAGFVERRERERELLGIRHATFMAEQSYSFWVVVCLVGIELDCGCCLLCRNNQSRVKSMVLIVRNTKMALSIWLNSAGDRSGGRPNASVLEWLGDVHSGALVVRTMFC